LRNNQRNSWSTVLDDRSGSTDRNNLLIRNGASGNSGLMMLIEKNHTSLGGSSGLLGQIPINKGQPVEDGWVKMKDISATVELWFVK
jgi:hypothetical protein